MMHKIRIGNARGDFADDSLKSKHVLLISVRGKLEEGSKIV